MAKAPGGKLRDEHKAFVVVRLACYDSPKEVADALKAEHGIVLTPQGCEAYDPNKRAGQRLGKQWRDLFEKTRADFHANIERYVPEANKTVRVRHLGHAARAYREKGNYISMADMLERIAKEVGNVHSNRREVTGKDGAPLKVLAATSEIDTDDLKQELAQILASMGATLVQQEAATGGDTEAGSDHEQDD